MKTIGVSELRTHLMSFLKKVQYGERKAQRISPAQHDHNQNKKITGIIISTDKDT